MLSRPKVGKKSTPVTIPADTTSRNNIPQLGSYKGSSGRRTAREIPTFVSSSNRSSGSLK